MPDSLPGYIAVPPLEEKRCFGCAFEPLDKKDLCNSVSCMPEYRSDKRYVIFVKREEKK